MLNFHAVPVPKTAQEIRPPIFCRRQNPGVPHLSPEFPNISLGSPDRIPVTATVSPAHSFSPATDDTTQARFLSKPRMAFTYSHPWFMTAKTKRFRLTA